MPHSSIPQSSYSQLSDDIRASENVAVTCSDKFKAERFLSLSFDTCVLIRRLARSESSLDASLPLLHTVHTTHDASLNTASHDGSAPERFSRLLAHTYLPTHIWQCIAIYTRYASSGLIRLQHPVETWPMRCTVLPGASHHPFGDPLLIGAGRESGPGRQVGQVTKEGHTTCFWLFFIPSSCESIAPFLPSRRSPP